MDKVLFSSNSVHWSTPVVVYEELNKEFHFNLDPCPLYSLFNGLEISWKNKRVFCNPPYGPVISDWLKKGIEAEIAVYLLPARTDTKWFHDIVLPNAFEIRFLRGRLKFGGSKYSAPFPSMVVIYGGNK